MDTSETPRGIVSLRRQDIPAEIAQEYLTKDPPKPEEALARRGRIRTRFQLHMDRLAAFLRGRYKRQATMSVVREQLQHPDFLAGLAETGLDAESVIAHYGQRFIVKGTRFNRMIQVR